MTYSASLQHPGPPGRGGSTHSTSIIISQENVPHAGLTGQSYGGIVLIKIPSSQMTLACVELLKKLARRESKFLHKPSLHEGANECLLSVLMSFLPRSFLLLSIPIHHRCKVLGVGSEIFEGRQADQRGYTPASSGMMAFEGKSHRHLGSRKGFLH